MKRKLVALSIWIIFTVVAINAIWLFVFVISSIFDLDTLIPRHQEIVSRILGEQHAWFFTKAIGVAEILMVVWILSRIKSRFCAIFQMAIVGAMNVIEFMLAADILLFGRMNIVFASLFIALIYFNEFVLRQPKSINQVV